ncbi:MAG: membrane protein insertion efficiency factor YidD [Fidelibacterota bacterium]|nr:MAG: membrane protein insertion efficiency factor YidD [Candidatus Neomarinimicrobiota bacterium]
MKDALTTWIRVYQKAISTQDLPSCVFHPSCSRFALGALREYGSVKGYLLTADRLLRCNPFAYFYYPFDGEKFVDPVSTYGPETAVVTVARERDR